MRELLEHWKEGAGVFLYFGFLAFFTPKAEALGWGYKGILFCVVAGGLLIFLMYLIVKLIAEYIEEHREEVHSFKEYMGIGNSHAAEQVSLAQVATGDGHPDAELDALLANNPYASAELFDDERFTRLLPVAADPDETILVEEPEETGPGGRVAAIIGENPRRRLVLADNFQPDAGEPLSTGVLCVAMPGGGKTVTIASFLEQYILLCRLAVLAFDLEGDLTSIVRSGLCPRGMVAGPDDLPSMAYLVQHRIQLVVDLQQCRKPGEEFIHYELAARLIARTVKDLLNAQAAIRPADRLPCLLALDETQLWTPQNPPSYLDGKTYKDLLDTLTIVATRGRKYGVVPFLAAQRIAKVHKDIIAGCETRIFGKTDLDVDIKRYREYVSPEVISDQEIRGLRKGRMVVCMGGRRLIVQFNNRKSQHTSHTPSLTGALNNPVGRIPADILAMSAAASRPVEVPRPAPVPTPVYVPRHPETHMEPLIPVREPATNGSLAAVKQAPPPLVAAEEPEEREIDLQEAARLWRAGHDSVRRLAAVLSITLYQAGKVYNDLVEAGLITRKPVTRIRRQR